MRIYTRTGDAGETGLLDGQRVSKADPRVDAYGDVDELNAWLGAVVSAGIDRDLAEMLVDIQRCLFSLGASLADPSTQASGHAKVSASAADVERLEGWIDSMETELAPLKRFILPGGHPTAATIHIARTVCRRAERRVTGLGLGAVDSGAIVYLNRLSDLLFVLARVVNARAGVAEQEW